MNYDVDKFVSDLKEVSNMGKVSQASKSKVADLSMINEQIKNIEGQMKNVVSFVSKSNLKRALVYAEIVQTSADLLVDSIYEEREKEKENK